MKKKLTTGALAWSLPLLALAQFGDGDLGNVQGLTDALGGIVDTLLPIVVGIALLAFFWGLATYIFNAGNEEAKDRGKRIMIGGVIALFVMVSIWGIVGFIGGALGIGQGGTAPVPGLEN